MLSSINELYFELAGIAVCMFLLCCTILGLSITKEQVDEKESTGETKYTFMQNVLIYIGVGAFWFLIFVSLSTLVYEMFEMFGMNFGM